jgi:hypothetical protein
VGLLAVLKGESVGRAADGEPVLAWLGADGAVWPDADRTVLTAEAAVLIPIALELAMRL